VTRRRLRTSAMVALVVALLLFVSTVQVLRWIAVVLVLASILVLTWTLFTAARRDVR
jgi:multidrug transporter EmrE-like cation transporter